MRKVHEHERPERARIDRILEINLAVWVATQKLKHAVSGKTPRAAKPILEAKHMAAIDDAIKQLTQTVADAGTAVDAAVAKLAQGSVTPAQTQAITDASTALAASTAKLNTAVTG